VFIEGATSTEVFKLSFLRNSESFFAYHNAESVLDGLQFESLGQVPHKLDLKFKLDGFTNAHELSFNFDPKALLPKRICVVIGKNGVGKSQALGHLARAALAGDESFSDGSGNRPSVNRLVAIGTPGEARVTFPAERRGTGKIYYRRLLLSRNNGKDGWRGLGELLVQLARSEESVKENDRWRIFCDSLSTIIPLNELAVPLREGADLSRWGEQFCCGTTTYMGLEKFRRTGEQARLETWGAVQPKSDPVRFINGKVYGLSSGQLAFLRFAAQVCLYIDNSTLVLLDEPETHLHPNLISDFVDLLDKLLEATGSIAIIATHSVYFVREVPRSQTQILKEGAERSIEVQTPRLRTFGADVGSISHFVFADNMTNKLLEKVKEKITESNCNIENFLEEVEGELSMEAVMSLRRKLAKEGTA
jgi:energy-coupling factor transporter ATP-binding protein EcfA2